MTGTRFEVCADREVIAEGFVGSNGHVVVLPLDLAVHSSPVEVFADVAAMRASVGGRLGGACEIVPEFEGDLL